MVENSAGAQCCYFHRPLEVCVRGGGEENSVTIPPTLELSLGLTKRFNHSLLW